MKRRFQMLVDGLSSEEGNLSCVQKPNEKEALIAWILCRQGRNLMLSGNFEEAARVLAEALTYSAYDCNLIENMRYCYTQIVPAWHFRMLNDSVRNAKYVEAIQSTLVCPDTERVLDVGCGSGLLTVAAIQSPQFGGIIVGIEQSHFFSGMAKNVIKRLDSLGGAQWKVETNSSFDFVADKPFQLLITELFDCSLIGEHILSVLDDLYNRNVITPNTRLIPHSAHLHIGAYQSDFVMESLCSLRSDCPASPGDNYTSYPLSVLDGTEQLLELACKYNVIV